MKENHKKSVVSGFVAFFSNKVAILAHFILAVHFGAFYFSVVFIYSLVIYPEKAKKKCFFTVDY